MLGAAFNQTYSVAVANAALIALTLVLPALLVGYVRQATRRVTANFRCDASRLLSSTGRKRSTARFPSA